MNKHIGFNEQVTNEINSQVIDLFTKAFEFKTQYDVQHSGSICETYLIDVQDAFWEVVKQAVNDFKEANKDENQTE